jgi:hypothetical protein
VAEENAVPVEYNEHKYWVESSDLTEAEKIQMAKDLRELESRGVIQFRGGRWQLAGVEVEEMRDGPHSNRDGKREEERG